ncbi:MAG: helix-turn-helix transcriptional regulator [Clostridia bacterium]|nr:helix-turn-helix transcriptional regulator [Clostridia bacterium]
MQRSIDTIKFVGNRIKYFRHSCGMTRDESAREIGVSPRTLAAYERGEREMSLNTAISIARLYNVTVNMITDEHKIGK